MVKYAFHYIYRCERPRVCIGEDEIRVFRPRESKKKNKNKITLSFVYESGWKKKT